VDRFWNSATKIILVVLVCYDIIATPEFFAPVYSIRRCPILTDHIRSQEQKTFEKMKLTFFDNANSERLSILFNI